MIVRDTFALVADSIALTFNCARWRPLTYLVLIITTHDVATVQVLSVMPAAPLPMMVANELISFYLFAIVFCLAWFRSVLVPTTAKAAYRMTSEMWLLLLAHLKLLCALIGIVVLLFLAYLVLKTAFDLPSNLKFPDGSKWPLIGLAGLLALYAFSRVSPIFAAASIGRRISLSDSLDISHPWRWNLFFAHGSIFGIGWLIDEPLSLLLDLAPQFMSDVYFSLATIVVHATAMSATAIVYRDSWK